MAYLKRTAEIRKNLRTKFPWARTVICLAYRHPSQKPADGLGRHIARYAQGDDYHEILDGPLKEVEAFIQTQTVEKNAPRTWRYIDTGPVMEKLYAAQAGIGWIGKNTLILNESQGSYLLLAEIITDLDLPTDSPVTERCGSCTRCLDACPTRAFVSPYVLDATKCISYQTIETKKEIPADVARRLEGNLFGCDICQEVCPWNRDDAARGALHGRFESRKAYLSVTLANFKTLSDDDFKTVFRKSPLKRPGLEKLREVARTISGPPAKAGKAEEKIPTAEPPPTPRSSISRNKPSA